jgi:alpha-L-fucosidase
MIRITRRDFCGSLAAATVGVAALPTQVFGQQVQDDGSNLPRPTPQQLAWQDMELGLFIHFGMATFTGEFKPRTPADPNRYNPAKLDTDQWLEAAKSMGAKYAVFVAKHCTGFLQWQSDAYPYGLRQTAWRDGKGDVVRDFVASCEKYGIKPGLYASVSSTAYWTADNPGLVNWGRGGDPDKQAQYAKACETLLTELWSNYGELTEVWFDGGALAPEKGGPDMVPILKEHQPRAIVFQGPAASIRWIGNEIGVAGYPCWATTSEEEDVNGPGDPDGTRWLPGECDVPLPGHEWFWTPEQNKNIRPLRRLMSMYYKSVGRNCNLLLNATPDTTGLIPEANMKHYAAFGKEIRRRFSKPVAETNGEGNVVELALERPTKIDHVIIMEDIAHGERVRAYEIDGLVSRNKWQKLCDGISIGHKRIQQFESTEVAKIRFRATKTAAVPKIRNLAVFSVA